MPYGRAEAFSVSINAKVFCMRGFKFIEVNINIFSKDN